MPPPSRNRVKVRDYVLGTQRLVLNPLVGQPDFRGPRPVGRGWDTPDIGRVATCRIFHEIYSNVHQLATC